MDPHHHHHPCHVILPSSAACCQHQPCYTATCHPPPFPHLNFQTHPSNFQNHHIHPSDPQNQHIHQEEAATISSLLRRISALESALESALRCHVIPAKPPSRKSSLREAAARCIQTHFRAFLVRRSNTLRQLKTLASVKSSLDGLKLSVSGNTRVDYLRVSRKAMDLLLIIDSIHGCDSMIRDGKRSISRNLDQFLQFTDGFSTKRNKLSSIGLKNSKTRVLYNGQQIDAADFVISAKDERGSKERANRFYNVTDDQDEDAGSIELENFRVLNNGKFGYMPKGNGRLAKRHGGELARTKINVTFAENEDLSRVSNSTHEPSSSEDSSSGEEAKLSDNIRVLNNGKIGSLAKRNGGLAKRHCGDLVKAKKNVTFADNRDLSRVFVNTREPNLSDYGSVDEEGELLNNLCRRVEKIAEISKENGDEDQEAYSEDEESSQISNGEENLKRVSRAEGNYVCNDDDFVFSAPMPVKMESRADFTKTRKA